MSEQNDDISDFVRAKMTMIVPVLEATLHSLSRDRISRLGGINRITLHDLSREFRAGSGDTGICFEYAVHDAIANRNPLIHSLASEVLENFCSIKNGANSLLFGPEKDGVIPIIESIQDALTEDAVVYVGNRGRPPKLRKYIPQIVRAFRRHDARSTLPRSISGLWKADLFIGNVQSEQWVGTTVKINPSQLQGAQGLRIGIYPKRDLKDTPRIDSELNLIRLPLPYDSEFMEFFYKSFFLVRAFMNADARVPSPAFLPDAEDRMIANELQSRRIYPVQQVIEAFRSMSQPGLMNIDPVQNLEIAAQISETDGLINEPTQVDQSPFVSLTPIARSK